MLTLYLSLIDTQDEKDRFEYIYLHFRKQMLYIANQMVKNPYDAEDIVHNTFISIAKNIHIFDNKKESSIYSYLVCATKGHAQNFTRKKNNELNALYRLYHKENLDLIYTIDSEVDYDFLINEIVKSIKELDELYSIVIYLNLVEDLSCKQIACLLDRKQNTVKKQITRGKKILYSKLKEKGICDEK